MLKKIIKYLFSYWKEKEKTIYLKTKKQVDIETSISIEDCRVYADGKLKEELLRLCPLLRINNDMVDMLSKIGTLCKNYDDDDFDSYTRQISFSVEKVDLLLDRAIILILLNSKGVVHFIKIDTEEKYLTISGIYILGKCKILDLNNVLKDENPSSVASIKNHRYLKVESRPIAFTVTTRNIEKNNIYQKKIWDSYLTADYEISTEFTTISIVNNKLVIIDYRKQFENASKPLTGDRTFDCYLK